MGHRGRVKSIHVLVIQAQQVLGDSSRVAKDDLQLMH